VYEPRGRRGAAAPESGKAISFQANATFLGRSQQVKMKTNISFCTVFIDIKNGNLFHPVR